MNKLLFKIIFYYLTAFSIANSLALTPVENMVLGTSTEKYDERENDPLFYVFKPQVNLTAKDLSYWRNSLAIYRGFYEEGKNLDKFCKIPTRVEYTTPVDRAQVLRSFMAAYQYQALDLATRAIPQYAKYFEFSRNDYQNLVDNLVGNYCSNNLTIISKKELKNNLLLKFDKENLFTLPSLSTNPLFPETLKKQLSERTARENEFKLTVKLFQNACSWGGNPRFPGLLLPFFKDSILAAYIIRQMTSNSIEWNELKNTIYINPKALTQPIWCEGIVCRKTTKEKFENRSIKSLGSSGMVDDLKRLYCDDMKSMYFAPNEYDPKLSKMMNSFTLDEEILINSQFIALITGYPDLFLSIDKFNKGEEILRASIDQIMNDWSKDSIEKLSKELYYEEALTMELVERKQYFNPVTPELKVVFDVNLGEFDKINQIIGKIKIAFEINVQKSFLKYFSGAVLDRSRNNSLENKKRLLDSFKNQITKSVQAAKDKLMVPPWKGDLEGIIANELTEQIILKYGDALKLSESGNQKILIELNYAPFALKYINHQFIMKKNKSDLIK